MVAYADTNKRVLIVMGSASDRPVMERAASILNKLKVDVEMRIASAHRSPEFAAALSREAEDNGFAIIIAGAGLAAHLPGVLAAYTTLPVIGVPIAGGALNGVDSLYAIVQMPKGVPVATVAIDGAHNAGILAAQMLAIADPEVSERLQEYRRKLAAEVVAADEELALSREFEFQPT